MKNNIIHSAVKLLACGVSDIGYCVDNCNMAIKCHGKETVNRILDNSDAVSVKKQETEQKIPINTVLITRDGFKVGNAIVVSYNKGTCTYKVKTDYGTTRHWDEDTLRSLFHIGKVADSTHKFYQFWVNNG